MINKDDIVATLKERFVTRQELSLMLETSDRQARDWMQELKQEYPVISVSSRKGYKIATSEEDIELAAESARQNRSKALSIFEGQKELRRFLDSFNAEQDKQLSLDF